MAPSATTEPAVVPIVDPTNVAKQLNGTTNGSEGRRRLIDRSLSELPLTVTDSNGNYLHLSNGQKVFDASCGAAVACLGHGNQEVNDAIQEQSDINSYCNSMLFTTPTNGKLAEEVILGTGNLMERVYICSSGKSSFPSSSPLTLTIPSRF